MTIWALPKSVHKCDLVLPQVRKPYAPGTLEHVQDLASLYKARMAGRTPTLADFKEELWVGLKEFKDTLSRRDIDYADFALLVAGFIERRPKIFCVDYRTVIEVPMFQSIGTGGPSADGMLRWRNPAQHWLLEDVIYFVYEAKRFSI